MGLLIGVAFVAGIVTAISPCVLPVLPIVFAGGATGDRRRPYAIVAGLVWSFTLFTLVATALLSALGLPDDLLRNIAIVVVLLVGISLLWPRLGAIVERPFQALGRRNPGGMGGGFLLGVSLGLLFTPCAGPVIAAVAVLAATQRFSVQGVLVTFAYALGAGVVFLLLAIGAQRGMTLRSVRSRAPRIRQALGGLIVAVAIVMALGLDTKLAAHVPGYTRALQGLEESAAAQDRLDSLLAGESHFQGSKLQDYGQAPEFQGISQWLNSKPLTLASLRGKVVLIDFWTYSCVNCIRTLPYVKRWYETYRDAGLVVVGVHTPEFAFEHVPGNVENAVSRSGSTIRSRSTTTSGPGLRGATATGPRSTTSTGRATSATRTSVRGTMRGREGHPHAARGKEPARAGLGVDLRQDAGRRADAGDLPRHRPALESRRLARGRGSRGDVHDPAGRSPEQHRLRGPLARRAGADRRRRRGAAPPGLPRAQRLSRPRQGGNGRLGRVAVDGKHVKPVTVTGDRLYTLVALPGPAADHTLDLSFSPGTEAYAFTFG